MRKLTKKESFCYKLIRIPSDPFQLLIMRFHLSELLITNWSFKHPTGKLLCKLLCLHLGSASLAIWVVTASLSNTSNTSAYECVCVCPHLVDCVVAELCCTIYLINTKPCWITELLDQTAFVPLNHRPSLCVWLFGILNNLKTCECECEL